MPGTQQPTLTSALLVASWRIALPDALCVASWLIALARAEDAALLIGILLTALLTVASLTSSGLTRICWAVGLAIICIRLASGLTSA